QILAVLPFDAERRDLFRYHAACARARASEPVPTSGRLGEADVERVLSELNRLHGLAMFAEDPVESHLAYGQIVYATTLALRVVGARRQPLARVQILLYLHDAACVLNRPDL